MTMSKYFEFVTRTGTKPFHKVLLDNWQPAATVAMVSVPLSISLGIASVSGDDPAAPTMGVATAFWGGLSSGLFGSSDLNIVGPAGALSGMLNSYTLQFGGAGVLPYISMVSAIFVLFSYLLNLQRYFLLMPKAVFEGFTFAVAIIIGLNQLNMAFDLKPHGPKHEHFYENVIESFKVLDGAKPAPTIFFFVSAGLLLGLVKYVPKARGYPIPWTVLIPLSTMFFGWLSESGNFGGIELPTLKTKYGVLEARVFEFPEKSLSEYVDGKVFAFISASFGVAFVAVLETLISAKIAEQKTDWGFEEGRETLGLVVAHALCGVSGALPPTGVFVRTALNFSLGATHKTSQVLNALLVLIISVLAMPIFSYLPQASVAALLIFASVRMAPIKYIIELWRCDFGSFALLNVTMLICVFLDPVYGLIAGMVAALLRDAAETARADSRIIVRGSSVQAEVSGDEHPSAVDQEAPVRMSTAFDSATNLAIKPSPILFFFTKVVDILKGVKNADDKRESEDALATSELSSSVVVYEPVGPVVYLAADKHCARMTALLRQKPACVVVSLELVTRVDVDGCEALAKAVKLCQAAETDVYVVLPDHLNHGAISKAKWLHALRDSGHVHGDRAQSFMEANAQSKLLEKCPALSSMESGTKEKWVDI